MRLALPASALAASLALAGPAAAHAFLQSATPPVGGTVASPPTQVEIVFTESVEPRFSAIEVQDPSGARVDAGPVQAGSDGQHLLAKLRPLRPGTYKVSWRATSTDTHKTRGSYSFTVAP